jgi:hypothetical protein
MRVNTGLTPSVWYVHYEFVRVMCKAFFLTFGPCRVPAVSNSTTPQLQFVLAEAEELEPAA